MIRIVFVGGHQFHKKLPIIIKFYGPAVSKIFGFRGRNVPKSYENGDHGSPYFKVLKILWHRSPSFQTLWPHVISCHLQVTKFDDSSKNIKLIWSIKILIQIVFLHKNSAISPQKYWYQNFDVKYWHFFLNVCGPLWKRSNFPSKFWCQNFDFKILHLFTIYQIKIYSFSLYLTLSDLVHEV